MENNIPIKNYLIAIFIVAVTIFVTFLLADIYNTKKQYEAQNDIRMKFLTKIDLSNLEDYIIENHDMFIYLSDSSDESLEEFELQLKRMIIAMEYEKEIVYLDTKELNQDFYDDLKQKYFDSTLQDIEFNIIPNMLVVQSGKVTKILYTHLEDLRASDVIRFVTNNMVIE